jgi:O-antigen/teichoic acid export membrane protein
MALMAVLGPDLGRAVFGQEVGEYMTPLAVVMGLSCYCSVLSSVLNGVDQQRAVAAVSLLGGGVQLAFTLVLVPIPGVGMGGYVAGAMVSTALELVLCLWLTVRVTGLKLRLFQWMTAPGLAAMLAALNANLLLHFLKDSGLSPLCAGLIAMVFAILLYLAAFSAQGVRLREILRVKW